MDPSAKSSRDSSWESLHEMFMNIQKNYKLYHQSYKLSVNHSNTYHDFCQGRLDTYYLHCWLSMRDLNLLNSIVEELPPEVAFESTDASATNSSFSTGASKQKKRKSTAGVLEQHLQKQRQKVEWM